MHRRQFLKSSSLVLFSPFIDKKSNHSIDLTRFKIGLQLFSVRDAMTENPIKTLKSLKRMGYEDFETYGFDTINNKYYGFSPFEFKSIITDLNLSTSSGHYGVNTIMENSDSFIKKYIDSCINAAITLEDKYIVFPSLDKKYHSFEGYKFLIKKLNQMGKQISEAGLNFAYHNFGYDLNYYQEKSGLDWIIEETNPEWVKLEVDFYWVMHADKISPKKLIDKAKGRFKLWHIKDMHKTTKDYTELGNGSINYNEILPNPKSSGLEYLYLEQGGNYSLNSMQSAFESINFLKKNIIKNNL